MADSNQPIIGDDDAAQDITLHSYQDDLDTHGTDRVMDEFGDDPTKELGIPAARFKEELSRYDGEAPSDDYRGEEDDMREEIEGLDMDPDRDSD